MKDKTTYTLRSMITELICRVHSNEIDIPEAVNALLSLIEDGEMLPDNEVIVHGKVEPLFQTGVVPIMGHCEIQEIRPTSTGGWKYFVYNKKHTYSTGWITEDELIKKISLEKEKN